MVDSSPVVVVTGANGLVGAAVCRALVARSAQVRAVVRRAGSAPALDGVTEHVGDFADEPFARAVTQGADAVVTTVHPMGSSREVQHQAGVEGTTVVARAARDAGVGRLVHVSTAGVYDLAAGSGDVGDDGALLPEGSGDYPDTKNATDAALADVGGLTTVLVRPPAILGAGETSVWNTLRPRAVRDGERRANPARTWSWVHVDDLADFLADLATGAVPTADDPEQGPVPGATTPVVVAGEPATWRDYLGTVADALGVAPEWTDEPVWTGHLLTDRARRWGWAPRVTLAQALGELRHGLSTPVVDDVIARWHRYLRGELSGGLDELLADDVVFWSPVVHTPQCGRSITARYLEAASRTLAGDDFRYTKQVLSGETAVLEFETTVAGKHVNGVDIIRCDDAGRIVEFRVMVRPLQAIQALHEEMARQLTAGG